MSTKVRILTLLLFVPWVYGTNLDSYPRPNSSYVAVPTKIPSGTQVLELSDHNIATLTTGGFSTLKELLKLVMRRNIISTIEKDAFQGLDKLQALDLSYNKLSSIEAYYFDNIPLLKYLNLKANTVTSITLGSLASLQNLQNLILQGNQLTDVPWDELRGLPKLTTVDLNNNNLQTVPEGIHTGWPSLQALYYHDNPFHCDCRLRWLKKYIQGNLLSMLFYHCATPKSLQGAQLAMVPTASLVCTKASVAHWEGVVSVKAGETATLVCQAEGDPEPEIAWTTPDGTTIKQGENAGKMEVARHGTLTITKATREDGGAYTCTASNAGGQDTKVTKVNVVGEDRRMSAINATSRASLWESPEFGVSMGIVAILALTLGLIGVAVFLLMKSKCETVQPAEENLGTEKPTEDNQEKEKEAEKQAPRYQVTTATKEDAVKMSDVEKGQVEKETPEKEAIKKEEHKPPPLQVSDMGNV
ncbi:leucine-rich repeat and fibronectin type-III domain-containing protein 5-like [Branchiostoma lanceolatum]|uniref:leucine-rich repeat and fibronectin type-III domain-containing protein 5-like n=1 Tax=Branchiostoma lanceolatum TaxID=7740 RepID=UPI003456BB7B